MRNLQTLGLMLLFATACEKRADQTAPPATPGIQPASYSQPGDHVTQWPDAAKYSWPDSLSAMISPQTILTDSFTATPDLLRLDSVTLAYAVNARSAVPTHPAEPLSIGPFDLTPAELLTVYQTCAQSRDKPTTLAQLDGGYKLFQSSLSENQAASLGLIGIGSLSRRREAVVIRYIFYRYTRRNCTLGGVAVPVVWGVGIASTLHIKQLKGGAKADQLTGIAASVEFNRATVDMSLEVPGLTGTPIESAFPSAGSIFKFDVESYGTLVVAIDKIRSLISASGVTVTPQLLITDESIPGIRVALRGNAP